MARIEHGHGEGFDHPLAGIAVLVRLDDLALQTPLQHQRRRVSQDFDDLAVQCLIAQGLTEQVFQFIGIDVGHDGKVVNEAKTMVKVLMVCMGNICRSPMAEGVFRRLLEEAGLADQVDVDSAGTHADYHPDSPPDHRGQATALRRGVDLSGIRARRVTVADFAEFDHVLAMDRQNFADLQATCRNAELQRRIQLFLDFAPDQPVREVPDPYYGGPDGFEQVMDLIEAAAQGFLVHLCEQHRFLSTESTEGTEKNRKN